jgi:hypothetical protein
MAQRRMIDDWADEEFLPAKLCVKQSNYRDDCNALND